ncbi:hypothetical protein AQUCO_00201150v1, partial [Aquilegia coerulea]
LSYGRELEKLIPLPKYNMPCSKENLVTLFFNWPISFHFVHFFFNLCSILLVKFFFSLFSVATSQSATDGYQAISLEDIWFFTDDFLRKEEDLVADIIYDGEALLFLPKQTSKNDHVPFEEGSMSPESLFEDADDVFVTEPFTTLSPQGSDSKQNNDYVSEEEHSTEDGESITTPPSEADSIEEDFHSPTLIDGKQEHATTTIETTAEEKYDNREDANTETIGAKISEDGKFFILETKKVHYQEKSEKEIIGDLFTDGSTSKSSSEWRNSINYRGSGTEDPFSSSSRRSCQTWESYTVYQKYDEEMMFFDRYSIQKLGEAESLRSIQVRPRSVSERIVRKITTRNHRSSSQFHRNPYEELETAYVAQICLAWEALNWNYQNFKRFIASHQDEEDPGCPGKVAQQFQQFQVLLQRFIENEPYEHGRRPEVYARIRKISPKLLQVPEFIDSEDDQNEAGPNTLTSSMEFLGIMEDGIKTFMNFIKADKESRCQKFTDLFKRNRRIRVDPILLHFMKKTNTKKKKKIKDLYRASKCFRKKRLKEEDEMEILMCLIDLKVVSRVLKMSDISDEQLNWCEEKMSKVKVLEGKVLQRDSSPLFFPTH